MFIKYYELGYSVIPLKKSSKHPVGSMSEWSQWADEKQPEELIESFETKYPIDQGYGIGIILGKQSNLICIDVDHKNPDIIPLIKPSPILRLGRPERHGAMFYQYNDELNNEELAVKEKIDGKDVKKDKIDLLISRRYIVIPPSIHPDTLMPYTWGSYDTLENTSPIELPKFELRDLKELSQYYENKNMYSSGGSSFGGRNSELVAVVTAMLSRGESIEKTILEIYELDKSKNNPRLFTDHSEGFRAKNEDDAFNYARIFVLNVSKTLARKSMIPNNIAPIVSDPVKFKLKKLPELPGAMKEIKEEILRTSVKPNDVYATCGVISLFSVLCSTKYILKNNRPATFCMLLGETGSGKDSIRSFLNSVLSSDELRKFNLLGIQNYVSAPATVIDLPKQRTRLDIVDEFSSFIKAAANPMINYKREVMTELTQILTLNDDYYAGIRAVGRQETGACHAPSISLLAMVQPRTFIESANRDMLESGYFSRFMYFYSDEINEMNREALLADHKSYPVTINAIKQLFPKPETIDIGEDILPGSIKPRLSNLVMSREVENHYVDAICCFDKKKSSDEIEQILLTRAGQNMNKLAQMFAVACGRLAVLNKDIDLAQEMVETLIYNSAQLLKEATGDGYKAKMHERFISFMAKRGSASSKQVNDLFKGQRQLRKSIIEDCIESGAIIVDVKGKKIDYHFQSN